VFMDFPAKHFKKIEGVAAKAQPFFIQAKENNDTVVMIIHGFTSSPYRLHFIADILASQGYDVDTILLAGHGGGLENLRQSTAQEWLGAAEMALQAHLKKYKKIYILGYSFGANLAIHLGVHYPQIKAIVALGIPITLYKEKTIRIFLPWAKIFWKHYKKKWIEKEQISSLYERGHHIYIPIKSLVELRNFIHTCTKKDIPRLKIPILIIHSRQDKVSNPVSSHYLYDHLNVSDKNIYIMNQGDHQLENGVRKDFIAKKILDFLARH